MQFVVDKVRARFASWKTKFLSKAGKLYLISFTLFTISAYYMHAIVHPRSTLNNLDNVCDNFIWGKERIIEGIRS